MTEEFYQVDIVLDPTDPWARLSKVEAWCEARGLPFAIGESMRRPNGARVFFALEGVAREFMAAFDGELVTDPDELARARQRDEELSALFDLEAADHRGEFEPPPDYPVWTVRL